jgi:hypothetical protein
MDVVLMGEAAKKKGRCRLRIGPCVDLWLFLNHEGDRSARQLLPLYLSTMSIQASLAGILLDPLSVDMPY